MKASGTENEFVVVIQPALTLTKIILAAEQLRDSFVSRYKQNELNTTENEKKKIKIVRESDVPKGCQNFGVWLRSVGRAQVVDFA